MRTINFSSAVLALIVCASAILPAHATPPTGTPPLPPPRPPELRGARPAPTPPSEPNAPATNERTDGPISDQECLDRLKTLGVQFETALPTAAKEACTIDTPVRLKRVPSRAGTVQLPDEPVLACRFGERLAHWIGDLVAPVLAGRLSADLKAVRTGPGFECRNRNRAAAGKLSAHATGLAVDIASFELVSGKALPVKSDGDERGHATVEAVRTAACGWFTTVLGPGSDAAHSDHMHVDILQHGSSERYRICQ